MFTSLVRNFITPASADGFETAVAKVTSVGDTNPPAERDLQNVMTAFSGKSYEIRGTSAFYLIIAKLQASKSKTAWNFIMKHLVILDKAVENRYFTKEIAELELPELEEYLKKKNSGKMESLIKRYFRYIKAKARIYNTKHQPFHLTFWERKEYLEKLDQEKLILESKRLKPLIILAFDIFATGNNNRDVLSYKLNQYIFLLTLNTLINALSMQYINSLILLDRLINLNNQQVHDFYNMFKEFLKDISTLQAECARLKFIPGFALPNDQICDPEAGKKAIKSIEEYLEVFTLTVPNLSLLKTKSVEVRNHDLKLKSSDINLASFVQILDAKPKGDEGCSIEPEYTENVEDDDLNTIPEVTYERHSATTNGYMSSPDRFSPSRYKNPKKLESMKSKTFQKSLEVGFRYHVQGEEEEFESPTPNFAHDDLFMKTMNRSAYFNIDSGQNLKVPMAKNVTPLFTQLLALEEHDEIFEQFNNFYSPEYLGDFTNQYEKSERGSVRVFNRLKTKGYLPSDNLLNEFGHEVLIIQDFEQDVFDNFTNNFSNN